MLRRIVLALILSWSFSITLGLLFASCTEGRLNFRILALPAVVPVALLGSTIAALGLTPVAVWSLRTGGKNLHLYGPMLWAVLAIYIIVVAPKFAGMALYGSLFMAVFGLIALGSVPARR